MTLPSLARTVMEKVSGEETPLRRISPLKRWLEVLSRPVSRSEKRALSTEPSRTFFRKASADFWACSLDTAGKAGM